MPCNSEYLEPTSLERERQRAAKLLIFVLEQLPIEIPVWVTAAAKQAYEQDDRAITELCLVLKTMKPDERDRIVYNAHNRNARDLANWWEDHQEADLRWAQEDARRVEQARARANALEKLTPEEREALGV